MAGKFIFLQPARQPNKELKVQNMYQSSSKNFQPGTTDEQRTKVDEMHVSPAIAKPTVVCLYHSVRRTVNEEIKGIFIFKAFSLSNRKKLKNYKFFFLSTEKGKQKMKPLCNFSLS